MSEMYYNNEDEARADITLVLKPIFGTAHLIVAEREAINITLRSVIFVARVRKDDSKSEQVTNAFYILQKSSSYEKLEWQGTKIDFINGSEDEYIMIKAVIQNG